MTEFVSKNLTVLRSSVEVTYDSLRMNSSDIHMNTRLKLDNYTEKEILWTILMTTYLPDDIRCVYQIELAQQIRRRVPLDDRELFLELLRIGRGQILCYLMDTSYLFRTTNELFGWILRQRKVPRIQFVKFQDVKYWNNPVNHSRKRGYSDKGTLGSYKVETEWIKDWSNSLEEEKRAEREKDIKDLTSLILNFVN